MTDNENATELEVLESSNGHALEAISRAEIDMQISTAKRYPRTISKVKADMLTFATMDEETAAACCYALPRGGKMIKGPSIRLAEIAISSYGNLRAGSRVISTETTGPTPHVVVQSVAHDLEKNVAITIEKRRRITKKKSKASVDEDDINLACNACASIALRDAVFKVVPMALIKPVYEAARKVAVGEIKSLVEKRGKVVDRLKQMGVTEDRILSRVEARKVDDIDLDKLEILIGLGTALKDGETTLEEAFPHLDGSALVKDDTEDYTDPNLRMPKPEPPKDEPKPPQVELEIVVTQAGFTFDDFRKVAGAMIENADSYGSFGEIPKKDAERLLRAKVGLLKQIQQAKGVAA